MWKRARQRGGKSEERITEGKLRRKRSRELKRERGVAGSNDTSYVELNETVKHEIYLMTSAQGKR